MMLIRFHNAEASQLLLTALTEMISLTQLNFLVAEMP